MTHLCAFAILALAATIAPAFAEPQPLHGDQFMSMMQSNTLSGTNDAMGSTSTSWPAVP